MGQTPTSYDDNLPCPKCGSEHLIQHVTRSDDVHVDSDGNIEHFEARDSVDVQELWCPECDVKLWERDD